ncbi:Hypothetical protein A7982_08988 [Minicystis rosea]|nr:Hypothetical protein A7982_08988 [Minicystis rosea]
MTAFAAIALAGAAGGCDDRPPPTAKACPDALARGQGMLAVPDIGAARDWLDQAKKLCGPGSAGEIDAFAKAIDEAEKKKADADAQRKKALEPKPASESLAPSLLAEAERYRADKARAKCPVDPNLDEGVCTSSRTPDKIPFNLATARGDADAFSVFATLPKELADCAVFHAKETKSWQDGSRRLCAIEDGPLKGALVYLKRDASRPETDATIYTAKWLAHDATLQAQVAAP